jgi:hypothetical protein
MNKNRFVSIGVVALAVVWIIHFATNHFRQFGPLVGRTTPTSEGPSALVRSLRPSYPYSVIPGGAYSPAELQFANSKDAVVRAHYSDFDVKHAKVVRLMEDRFQYVSYRTKDQIFWTKKKLRIPGGELLLTDGASYARARCGNRLSDKPHSATSAHEPDTALLSLPPVDLDMLPKLTLAEPPVVSTAPGPKDSRTSPVAPPALAPWPADRPLIPVEPFWGGQPTVGPIGFVPPVSPLAGGSSTSSSGTGGSVTGPVTQPVNSQPSPPAVSPVPEPSTVYLFLLTLLFAGWALLRMSSSDDEGEERND